MPHAEAPRGGASCPTFSFEPLFFLHAEAPRGGASCPTFSFILFFSVSLRASHVSRRVSSSLTQSRGASAFLFFSAHQSPFLCASACDNAAFSVRPRCSLRAITLLPACDNAVLARPLRRDRAASTPQSPCVYAAKPGPLRGSRGRASPSCVRQRPAAHLQKRINGLKNDTFFQIIGQYFCAVSK